MGTIAINTNANFDDALQLDSFAMPASGFTFDIQIGLPSNWVVVAAAVPIVQYGAQSAHTNADFSISTWSDFLDVYIGGTRFDTTIPVSALIGSTHRVTITWDGASARAYMDGVAKGAQTLTPADHLRMQAAAQNAAVATSTLRALSSGQTSVQEAKPK